MAGFSYLVNSIRIETDDSFGNINSRACDEKFLEIFFFSPATFDFISIIE